jgi:ribbon-helix-helix CopG family protein
MNFDLYLDDQTAKELDRTAKKLGETRSGLIRKALREWLDKKTLGSPGWPSLVLEWQGVPDMPPFESYRGELRIPTKPATHSNRKPATDSDLKPAGVPI